MKTAEIGLIREYIELHWEKWWPGQYFPLKGCERNCYERAYVEKKIKNFRIYTCLSGKKA